MSNPFIGQVSRFAVDWKRGPPSGWVLCNGQTLDKDQYPLLFKLIGYTYGGSGQQFAVPDLQGRAPIGAGQGQVNYYALGKTAGVEQVTITAAEYGGHGHSLAASTQAADSDTPGPQKILAVATSATTPAPYPGAPLTYVNNNHVTLQTLDPSTVTQAGSGGANQPHENRQRYLAVSYCIAVQGVYPT